jgi:hypothetical protein
MFISHSPMFLFHSLVFMFYPPWSAAWLSFLSIALDLFVRYLPIASVLFGAQLAASDGDKYALLGKPQEAGGLLSGVVCGHFGTWPGYDASGRGC